MGCWSCCFRCCRCCDSDDSSIREKPIRPRGPVKETTSTSRGPRHSTPKRPHNSVKSLSTPERSSSQNTSRGRRPSKSSGRERSTSRHKRSRSRKASADHTSAGRVTPGRILEIEIALDSPVQEADEFARPRPDSQTLAAIELCTPRESVASSLGKVDSGERRDGSHPGRADDAVLEQAVVRDVARRVSDTAESIPLSRARTGSGSSGATRSSGKTAGTDQPSPGRVMISTSGVVYHLPPRKRSSGRKGSTTDSTSTLSKEKRAAQLMESMEIARKADYFHGHLTEFIHSMQLGNFYSAHDPYLLELCNKAAVLGRDPTLKLNRREDILDLTKLALFDTVVYCDDSGSMRQNDGERIAALQDLVRRVTKITTMLDTNGIKMRFINFPNDSDYNDIRTKSDVAKIMGRMKFEGGTKIGTGLERKILEPLVFARTGSGSLKRPLLVTTITDGEPNDEEMDHFRNAVLRCEKNLTAHAYKNTSVVFQVSQVGNAPEAEAFIGGLHNDSEVGHMVYCTSDKIDEKLKELGENERNLERWLLDLLMQGLRRPARPDDESVVS